MIFPTRSFKKTLSETDRRLSGRPNPPDGVCSPLPQTRMATLALGPDHIGRAAVRSKQV
jgi:hypothetical protein